MSQLRWATLLVLGIMLLVSPAVHAAGSIFDDESWDESSEPSKPGDKKPPPAPFKIEPETAEAAPTNPGAGGAPVDPEDPTPAPPPPPPPRVRLSPQDVIRINAAKIKAAGPQPARLTDQAIITLYHQKAIAHAQLGEMPAAREAMEKVLAAPLSNRSVALNAARLDVAGRRDAMRAATVLEKHLKAATDAPDEDALALWGMALATYARDRGKIPDVKVKAFETAEQALEASRPGYHRWGNRWLDEQEHKEIEQERAKAMAEVRRQQALIETDLRRYNELKARSRVRSRSERIMRLDPAVARQMEVVDAEIARKKKELAAAWRKVPRPAWIIPLKMQEADPNLKPE